MNSASFQVNGRNYSCPSQPIVAICLDGTSDEYLCAAMMRGLMPTLQRMCLDGVRSLARAAMPTFTNVNNASIVTGVPPSVHGICGNFFFDAQRGEEVMMNSADFLRAPTIFPAAAKAGRKVAIVTAKEKLRDIFAQGLIAEGGIAFSSERASHVTVQTHGIERVEELTGVPQPPIYSAEARLYVLQAGAALMRSGRADFLYLSTTDYIQHKAAPHEAEALEFYEQLDQHLAAFLESGARVGITADHGMNGKQNADGSPNVIYLETLLQQRFSIECRVILPITDPYVVHHGALGSFAMIHLPPNAPLHEIGFFLKSFPGITEVRLRAEAAAHLELPEDRIGDLLLSSGRNITLGRTAAHHDLTVLRGALRSHGGRYEEMVPFIFSHPLNPQYRFRLSADPRNFELFDFLINGTL
ncbi:MAG: phosphonoacetate hydrolase [Limisphaerales bacterium]